MEKEVVRNERKVQGGEITKKNPLLIIVRGGATDWWKKGIVKGRSKDSSSSVGYRHRLDWAFG